MSCASNAHLEKNIIGNLITLFSTQGMNTFVIYSKNDSPVIQLFVECPSPPPLGAELQILIYDKKKTIGGAISPVPFAVTSTVTHTLSLFPLGMMLYNSLAPRLANTCVSDGDKKNTFSSQSKMRQETCIVLQLRQNKIILYFFKPLSNILVFDTGRRLR